MRKLITQVSWILGYVCLEYTQPKKLPHVYRFSFVGVNRSRRCHPVGDLSTRNLDYALVDGGPAVVEALPLRNAVQLLFVSLWQSPGPSVLLPPARHVRRVAQGAAQRPALMVHHEFDFICGAPTSNSDPSSYPTSAKG